ncbi:hypothetical protein BC629DRAFT_1587199 [Irpex lacteus]|nr:hypothetical protein BC629DRAFT_1587199 [Irpex lacteus]
MEGPNAETFLGPCFAILCIVFMLYGLFGAQVYYYFTTYRDHPALRAVVFILCVLETIHVATSIHVLYTYLVIDFADASKLLHVVWSFVLWIFLEHTIDPIVQSYYIYRVWCVSQNRTLLFALVSMQLTRIAIGFRAVSFLCFYNTWEALGGQKLFDVYLNATLGLNVIVDFSIAFALTYYFISKSRSSAHTRSTKKILLKLTYYAITAGALTVLVNIIALITYNKSKTTLAYCGVLQIVVKLNANSMLAMLNARKSIRGIPGKNGVSLELSQLSDSSAHVEGAAIHVLQDTTIKGDKWDEGKHTQSSKSSEIADSTGQIVGMLEV